MVRRVFEMVYQEIRGLHQAAYVLAFFAFGSQILALVRDRLLAHQFGASVELDVYYAAFRIPDLLFVLFASTLSIYVLIPFVTKRENDGVKGSSRALMSQVFTLFLLVYIFLALGVGIAAPMLAELLFPGFTGAEHDELVLVMRILLLQPLLLGLSSLFGVVTQIGRRFMLYALSPLLYNLGIIFGIVALYPFFGIAGLGFGVVLGALAHMAVQIPFVRKSKFSPRITFSFDLPLLLSIFKTSIPRALTLSLHQIVFIAFIGAASVMVAGSVSIFQFAYNLQSVPLAIIGVSYSVAAFPTLARLFSKGEHREFVEHVATALRHLFFWSLPAMALIVVIRAQLVRVILGSGAFDWEDTRLTAAALALFSLSLIAQSINLLIIRAFYAGGNTRTPFVITFLSSGAALILGIGLYSVFITQPYFASIVEALMRVEGVPGTEILMLPLGYSIAITLHTIALLTFFIREHNMPLKMLTVPFMRACGAAAAAGSASYFALNILVVGIRTDTFLGIFLQGFIAGVVGLFAAAALLYAIRSPELLEVWKALRRRFYKNDIFTPQKTDDLAV